MLVTPYDHVSFVQVVPETPGRVMDLPKAIELRCGEGLSSHRLQKDFDLPSSDSLRRKAFLKVEIHLPGILTR
jgi:hypothetical protein